MLKLKEWLAHPLTRGLALDDPRTTERRRALIQRKPFLRHLYEDWYAALARAVPPGAEPVLEIGSGAGFLRAFIPGLITSEVFPCPGLSVVLDATRLPFADASLRALVLTDVLHHLAQPRAFFAEAARCVRPGGVVAMIEPWVTLWSRLIYTHLHHEPFQPDSATWEFPASGPLSGANGALPWILFARDAKQFAREFPEWQVQTIRLGWPFRYLVSGGVSMRALMPGAATGAWRALEYSLQPWMTTWAMFAEIVLARAA